MVVGAIGGVTCAAVAVGAAMAGQDGSGASNKASTKAASSISCPDVTGSLPEIPAKAQAEVDRNLALLQTQIDEANKRLASSAGEGGPNFVQNAILGPLADKRKSTLDRIAISIGRQAEKPQGLDALAECSLGGDAGAGEGSDAGSGGAAEPPASAPATAEPTDPGSGAEDGAGSDAGAGTGQSISCPDVASKVGAVPAKAQAEVDRNIALLQTQIDEANKRLASSVGQGGPNFVQNAILGPLEGKRASTIDRIRISISRQGATAPSGLDALAGCSLASG
jgi:F0F1-type ATP synthase membrane subunit b/b'